MMSARKAKRRVVDMMASTVRLELRWMRGDPEGERIMRWLQTNTGRAANMLRAAMRNSHESVH
jgi:hypothetical protein